MEREVVLVYATCPWELTRTVRSSAGPPRGGQDRRHASKGGRYSRGLDRRVFGRCLSFFSWFCTSSSDSCHLRASSFFCSDPFCLHVCGGVTEGVAYLVNKSYPTWNFYILWCHGLVCLSRGVISSMPLQRRRKVQNGPGTRCALLCRVWAEDKHDRIRKIIRCPSQLYQERASLSSF